MKTKSLLAMCFLFTTLRAADPPQSPASAPTVDRVGFPHSYAENFKVLRLINKEKEQKLVTVYGNAPAASITNAAQIPYPYGSVIVMETASALKSLDGKLLFDSKGNLRKDTVTGLHVMRREKGFGEAYGPNRTAEWEYVEYRADGSYLTPPLKSGACAECHVKAGAQRDFVYRGPLSANTVK